MARILIIDDSQGARDRLKEVLISATHEVVEAQDGNEGLNKILNTTNLDLVITDLNMPGFDGLTMLKKAKERLGTLKYPVFVLTTESSDSLKSSGKDVGVVAWITKPFVSEKLLKAIEKVTGSKPNS